MSSIPQHPATTALTGEEGNPTTTAWAGEETSSLSSIDPAAYSLPTTTLLTGEEGNPTTTAATGEERLALSYEAGPAPDDPFGEF